MKRNTIVLIVIAAVFAGIIALGVFNQGEEVNDVENDVTDSGTSDEVDSSTDSETETTADVGGESVIEEVDGAEFKALMNGSKKIVLYVMQDGCSYCEMFTPIINKVARENNIDVKYINLANMTTAEDQADFYGAHDYFGSGIGTPTTVVAQNGGIFGMIPGYVEEAAVIDFFEKHGYIE